MNDNPLHSEVSFFKPNTNKKSRKKKKKKKNPSSLLQQATNAAVPPSNINLVDAIKYLEGLYQLNKMGRDPEDFLANLEKDEKFSEVFAIQDEEVKQWVAKVIENYVEYPNIAAYLLYLCFHKFSRNYSSEENEPFYQALMRIIKLIMQRFEIEKNEGNKFEIGRCQELIRKIILEFVRYNKLKPLQESVSCKKFKLLQTKTVVLRYNKYELKPLETVVLIKGIYIAIGRVGSSSSGNSEIIKRILTQLENYSKYADFITGFYAKGNPPIPFEMEIIAYMAHETKNKRTFTLDLIPDTSDEDSNWKDLYICNYQTLPDVEPATYKKYYQYRVEADVYYQMLKQCKSSLEKLKNYKDTGEKLLTLLGTLYKLGDYNAGIMLTELALDIYKTSKGNFADFQGLLDAKKILDVLVSNGYELDETHHWNKRVPERVEFIITNLKKVELEVELEGRGLTVHLIIAVLRNLYATGSKPCGLLLAKLSIEPLIESSDRIEYYPVSFVEAAKILNELENYRAEECTKIQDAIKSLESEILPDTADNSTANSDAEDEEGNLSQLANELAEKVHGLSF